MELTIRHLSGSLAGQEQSFDSELVRLGRNPANDIAFDPLKDRVVSGSHAELLFRDGAWLVRDLGSSNGTFIGDEKVTERIVRPGEIVQLGKQGPRLELRYPYEGEIEPTVIVDMQAPAGAAVVEGRTVMMSLQSQAASSTAPPSIPKAKKPLSRGRVVLLTVGAAFGVLFILFAAAVLLTDSPAPEAKVAGTESAQKSADETETIKKQIEQTSASAAQTQASLQSLMQQQPASGATATDSANQQQIADMQRQLMESQQLISQLTDQLQTKNDEVAAARSRPVAAPRAAPSSPPRSTAAAQPSRSVPSAASAVASAPAAQAPPANLFTGKRLKTRVQVSSLPPEIPPANLPGGIERQLVDSFGAALVSTGDFVLGGKGGPSVSVTVTNYTSEAKSNVNVAGAANSAGRIAGLFGRNVPNAPGDVKTMSYDAAMSARIRAYDSAGRVVAEIEPSASMTDRKSKVSLAGVPFNQVVLSDSPAGDVARKVIGDAVDGMLQRLSSFDWSATVASHRDKSVTLSAGRSSRIDVGDVFEVITPKKQTARLRVVSLAENSCETELLEPMKEKLPGLAARYLGNETGAAPPVADRTVTIRRKTAAMDAPGSSFTKVKELKPGTTLKFLFSVGSWAKVSEPNGRSFWVPLGSAQIKS